MRNLSYANFNILNLKNSEKLSKIVFFEPISFSIWKIPFLYLFLFLLLYTEPIQIAGIKIGQIWKAMLVSYFLFVSVIFFIKKRKAFIFIFFSFIFAFKIFFSISSVEYIAGTIELVFENLFFPASFLFFLYSVDESELKFWGKHLSIFVILSFLPSIFGIIQPLSAGYRLENFGLEKDSFALIGLFQNPHSASDMLAFATTVIFFYFIHTKSRFQKLVLLFLTLLGSYFLFKVYVRTGMVMLSLSLLYILLTSKDKLKYLKLLSAILLAGSLFFFIYSNDPVLQMRLADKTIYYEGTENLGSGRLYIWENAIKNWYSEGITSIIIGLGEGLAYELMYSNANIKVFAHNGFLQILQTEGLIGIFLYIGFIWNYLKFIYNNKKSVYFYLVVALLIGYFSMMMFQGGIHIYMMMFLSLYSALLYKNNQYIKIINENNRVYQ